MKRLLRTEGIVLRLTRFKESSDIVSIFTRKLGKIRAVAKGRRRLKSRLRTPLELFSLSEIVVYMHDDRELQTLKEASLVRGFESFRNSHRKFVLAGEIAGFLENFLPEHQPFERIFDMTLKAFDVLENNDCNYGLVCAFKLKGMAFLGHKPVFDRCVVCGKPAKSFQKIFMDFEKGGLVCERCGSNSKTPIELEFKELQLLKFLMRSRFDELLNLHIPQNVQEIVNKLVEGIKRP